MFWDSSALIPLLVPESTSADMTALWNGDREAAIWWSTPVECQSAIYRRHREHPLPRDVLAGALTRLRSIADGVDVIVPTDEVRRRAGRLLSVHLLRAGDALQLAAALVWCEERPADEEFVSHDERLRDAAVREGFTVRP